MWWERAVVAGFVVVGVIHVVPGLGVFTPDRFPAAYGVEVSGPDLQLLLRHRAVLLGLVGLASLAAAVVPELRVAVLVGASISVTSFVVLSLLTSGTGAATARVARIDVAAAVVLAALAWAVLSGRAAG